MFDEGEQHAHFMKTSIEFWVQGQLQHPVLLDSGGSTRTSHLIGEAVSGMYDGLC